MLIVAILALTVHHLCQSRCGCKTVSVLSKPVEDGPHLPGSVSHGVLRLQHHLLAGLLVRRRAKHQHHSVLICLFYQRKEHELIVATIDVFPYHALIHCLPTDGAARMFIVIYKHLEELEHHFTASASVLFSTSRPEGEENFWHELGSNLGRSCSKQPFQPQHHGPSGNPQFLLQPEAKF